MGCLISKNENRLNLIDGTYHGHYRLVLNGYMLTKGLYTFNNGYKYKGCFFNKMYNGYGTLKNDIFLMNGYWKNNKLHGKSYIRFSNNIIYHGDFINGKPNGIISITINNYEYFGEIMNNKLEGFGVLKFNNENLYVGKWKNNKPHLKGKYYEDDKIYNVDIMNDNIIFNNYEQIKISFLLGNFKLINFPIEYPVPNIYNKNIL